MNNIKRNEGTFTDVPLPIQETGPVRHASFIYYFWYATNILIRFIQTERKREQMRKDRRKNNKYQRNFLLGVNGP